MIDFFETHFPDGTMSARVRADGLPKGMHYCVTLWSDGKCTARSQAYGNGSVRYYTHRTYEAALAHAYVWAKRKVAESKHI